MRDTLIGATATALTPLRPTGKVIIDGRRYDARCEAALVDADTEVRVIDVRGADLLVRPAPGQGSGLV